MGAVGGGAGGAAGGIARGETEASFRLVLEAWAAARADLRAGGQLEATEPGARVSSRSSVYPLKSTFPTHRPYSGPDGKPANPSQRKLPCWVAPNSAPSGRFRALIYYQQGTPAVQNGFSARPKIATEHSHTESSKRGAGIGVAPGDIASGGEVSLPEDQELIAKVK
jgi:hypothetical protein